MAAEILLRHGRRAGDEVAQVVREIGVDARNERLVREHAVRAEGDLAQQEVADRVHAVAVAEDVRIHDVALRLAHLRAVAEQQPAVAVHLLGQRQVERHEDGRPDDGVEAHNLLADKVDVGGPVLFIIGIIVRAVAHGGDVVRERVDPHINHVLRVEIHRDAPGEARAGNAEILQALLDERDHLVLAALRLDEAGLILIELEQPVRILRKAEEIGLLLGPLHLAPQSGHLPSLSCVSVQKDSHGVQYQPSYLPL